MAKGKKRDRKVPAQATNRTDTKSVRVLSSSPSEFPSWQFSTVDTGGPFAWPVGQEAEMEILNRLRQFDGMRWAEIEGGTHHSIMLSALSKDANDRLKEIHMDDLEEVFSFRLGSKKRVFCIKDNNVAKLLWWDPDHLVCPSKLKHT